MDRRLLPATAAAVAAGAALQLYFLLARDFYSISWDEAGRILDAYTWAFHGQVTTQVWLPFYRFLIGMALRIHPDLVLTPRIVTGLFGLGVIPAVGWLTAELFEDRRTTVAALFGAALFSQRVALSLAPLSSILFGFFVVCAMALLARWLRTGADKALFGSAVLLAVAGTVRYEGWLFSGSLLALYWFTRDRTLPRLALLGVVLLPFPLLTVAHNATHTVSPVEAVARTPHTTSETLLKNPLSEFVTTNAASLNLAGAIAALGFLSDDRRRRFLAVAFAPLAAIGGALLAVMLAQSGPSWRMIAVWSFLLLPFTASLVARRTRALAALGLAIAATFVWDLGRIARESEWAFPESDRRAGESIRRELIVDPGLRLQIESSDYFYLNVLLASQNPDAFELSREPDSADESVDRWLFQTPEALRILDSQPNVAKIRKFGPWCLYARSPSSGNAMPRSYDAAFSTNQR